MRGEVWATAEPIAELRLKCSQTPRIQMQIYKRAVSVDLAPLAGGSSPVAPWVLWAGATFGRGLSHQAYQAARSRQGDPLAAVRWSVRHCHDDNLGEADPW